MSNVIVPPVPDPLFTAEQLRTWGISGHALTMSPWVAQPYVAAIRAVNLGEMDKATLAPLFAGTGIDSTTVALAHPPKGGFTAKALDGNTMEFTANDADLDLPADVIRWDFGDETAYGHGAVVTHTYVYPDTYDVRQTVSVASVDFTTIMGVAVIGDTPNPGPPPGTIGPFNYTFSLATAMPNDPGEVTMASQGDQVNPGVIYLTASDADGIDHSAEFVDNIVPGSILRISQTDDGWWVYQEYYLTSEPSFLSAAAEGPTPPCVVLDKPEWRESGGGAPIPDGVAVLVHIAPPSARTPRR